MEPTKAPLSPRQRIGIRDFQPGRGPRPATAGTVRGIIAAMNDEHDYEDFDDDRPSKSELKRESHALQDLGETLVELPAARLARVPLTDELREAVELARRIKQRGGRKRQIKFIGKLLRSGDPEPIQQALAEMESQDAADSARHHLAERWRERLLEEGDEALTAFLDENPGADRQRLRQLVRSARQEKAAEKPPRQARELFRLVRDTLAQNPG